jgi:hypothetical protein
LIEVLDGSGKDLVYYVFFLIPLPFPVLRSGTTSQNPERPCRHTIHLACAGIDGNMSAVLREAVRCQFVRWI